MEQLLVTFIPSNPPALLIPAKSATVNADQFVNTPYDSAIVIYYMYVKYRASVDLVNYMSSYKNAGHDSGVIWCVGGLVNSDSSKFSRNRAGEL